MKTRVSLKYFVTDCCFKNSLLELEKKSKELKDREVRDGKLNIRKEIEKLFFKPIKVPIDEKEMIKKGTFPRNNWCDWWIKYIPEAIKKW